MQSFRLQKQVIALFGSLLVILLATGSMFAQSNTAIVRIEKFVGTPQWYPDIVKDKKVPVIYNSGTLTLTLQYEGDIADLDGGQMTFRYADGRISKLRNMWQKIGADKWQWVQYLPYEITGLWIDSANVVYVPWGPFGYNYGPESGFVKELITYVHFTVSVPLVRDDGVSNPLYDWTLDAQPQWAIAQFPWSMTAMADTNCPGDNHGGAFWWQFNAKHLLDGHGVGNGVVDEWLSEPLAPMTMTLSMAGWEQAYQTFGPDCYDELPVIDPTPVVTPSPTAVLAAPTPVAFTCSVEIRPLGDGNLFMAMVKTNIAVYRTMRIQNRQTVPNSDSELTAPYVANSPFALYGQATLVANTWQEVWVRGSDLQDWHICPGYQVPLAPVPTPQPGSSPTLGTPITATVTATPVPTSMPVIHQCDCVVNANIVTITLKMDIAGIIVQHQSGHTPMIDNVARLSGESIVLELYHGGVYDIYLKDPKLNLIHCNDFYVDPEDVPLPIVVPTAWIYLPLVTR